MTDNLPEALRRLGRDLDRDGYAVKPIIREAADTIEALTRPAAPTLESLMADSSLAERVLRDGARVVYEAPAEAAEPSLSMVYGAIMELRAEVKAMAAAVERKSTPVFTLLSPTPVDAEAFAERVRGAARMSRPADDTGTSEP